MWNLENILWITLSLQEVSFIGKLCVTVLSFSNESNLKMWSPTNNMLLTLITKYRFNVRRLIFYSIFFLLFQYIVNDRRIHSPYCYYISLCFLKSQNPFAQLLLGSQVHINGLVVQKQSFLSSRVQGHLIGLSMVLAE